MSALSPKKKDASEPPPQKSGLAQRLKRLLRHPALWLFVTAAMVTAVVFLLRARGPQVEVVGVIRRDIEQHLIASGRVRSSGRIEISSQIAAVVRAVPVREGQSVTRGELLIELADEAERAAVAQAEAGVTQARARVAQLRRVGAPVAADDVQEAESVFVQAQTNLDRAERLFTSGAVTAQELDAARRALSVATTRRTTARSRQAATGAAGPDTQLLGGALAQAEAQLGSARVRLEQTRLRASSDGVVLIRTVEPGDVVQPGRVLLTLIGNQPLELAFQSDERNLALIQLGQSAVVAADAYPDRLFPAEVTYLAPSIDAQRGSIEVRLAMPSPPDFLRPEMTVSVDLTLRSRSDVLTLPSASVRNASSSPWVFLLRDGRLIRQPVELGIRGEGTLEIVSGLTEGARVALETPTLFRPGQRVRARPQAVQ